MVIRPTLTVDERFKKRVQARYERFDIQGGILQDKPHHDPRPAKKPKKTQRKLRSKADTNSEKPKKKSAAEKKKKSLTEKVKTKIKKKLTSKKAKAAALRRAHTRRGLGTLEGGPVRLQKPSTTSTTAAIAERIRKELGVNWLVEPVRRENSPEMKALRKAFFDLLRGRNRNYSAVEAKFRAVLRIPILRGRYGRNTAAAARVKTFNRKLIDTGQFFKAILAKVKVRKR